MIRDAIRAEDKRLRSRFFFLREEWQDAVGLLVHLSAALAWATVSFAWYEGKLSALPTIVFNAFAISFLHEMEHDLIHDLYFKKVKWVQNAMFGTSSSPTHPPTHPPSFPSKRSASFSSIHPPSHRVQ